MIMKTGKFAMLFMSLLLAFSITSCSDSDDDVAVTGISLDESTASFEVGLTTTLVASILPSDADGIVTWTTSDETIATVEDGVVTGIAIGTATITATVEGFSAECEVTVTESTDYSASLEGSNYYVFSLDGTTATTLGDKIVADFRANEETTFLYVWNGLEGGTSSGPNFYGEVEDWVNFVISDEVTWSGAGWFCNDESLTDLLVDVYTYPEEYYFHMGIKSTDDTNFRMQLGGQTNAYFCLGDEDYVDGTTTYTAVSNFTRDGEWHEIEIPMTTFIDMGLVYTTSMGEINVFVILPGSVAGVNINLDAMFIYKK
jgi:hypothetical protein